MRRYCWKRIKRWWLNLSTIWWNRQNALLMHIRHVLPYISTGNIYVRLWRNPNILIRTVLIKRLIHWYTRYAISFREYRSVKRSFMNWKIKFIVQVFEISSFHFEKYLTKRHGILFQQYFFQYWGRGAQHISISKLVPRPPPI